MAATLTLVAACGSKGTESTIVGKKSLKIGVKEDQPGLGFKGTDGRYAGFDIEIAKLVAKQLGVDEGNIEFVTTVSANREPFLQQGKVDMVVASYTITDDRKKKVSFAGPYYVAGQDLLVKADNTAITGPQSLDGKTVCSVSGSTPAKRIETDYPKAKLQKFDSYSKCVAALLGGNVDAVTTDDIILAGYAAQHPGELKVVGKTFSTEPYGIGLALNDKKGRDAVNDALQKIFTDGSYATAWVNTLGKGGTPTPKPPTLARY
ncbi:MAG TPA: glutamate ABC transporter substrate-binding protein [Mycobacteriales bacterium]|nr:glutamate ABC transporter substrate-binding protein [Mycobacteriales bacterium]